MGSEPLGAKLNDPDAIGQSNCTAMKLLRLVNKQASTVMLQGVRRCEVKMRVKMPEEKEEQPPHACMHALRKYPVEAKSQEMAQLLQHTHLDIFLIQIEVPQGECGRGT